MTSSRSLPWLIAVTALAGALGLWLGQRWYADHGATGEIRSALVYPQPRSLAPFQLERGDGQSLTLDDWRGRWSLVFIGFTHCPDACPQTLAVFRNLLAEWPDDAGPAPALYFVSVDPERDSAQAIDDYARYFSTEIVAATGEQQALEPFAQQLGMVYMKTPLDGDGYTIDHSTHVAVIDPQARMAAMFRQPLRADAMAADLQVLIETRRNGR